MTWRDPNLICINIYIEAPMSPPPQHTGLFVYVWVCMCAHVHLHASFALTSRKSMGFVSWRYFQCKETRTRQRQKMKAKELLERNVCLVKFQIKHSVFNTLNNGNK